MPYHHQRCCSVKFYNYERLSLAYVHLNIAKGTTDPRVEFISQVQIQILIKFHLKNLDQASTSKSQPNISLSINLKLQNLDQTSCKCHANSKLADEIDGLCQLNVETQHHHS